MNGYGIDLDSSNSNNLTGNTVANSEQQGIHLSSSSDNAFTSNTVNNNSYWGIWLSSSSDNTLLTGNNLSGSGFQDLLISSSAGTYLQDQQINSYSLTSSGLIIENTSSGKLAFLNDSMTVSGYNLSQNIVIGFNSTFVNSTAKQGFNTSAEITLYNVNIPVPQIMVDYSDSGSPRICPAPECNVISGGENATFNVTHFTTYFVREETDNPPQWSNNRTSIVPTYSPSTPSVFNITWTDDIAVSTVYLESNSSGTDENYSMTSLGSGRYSYSAIMPAGGFYWRSLANDSSNNWSSSDVWTFTVAKAGNPVTLLLNGEGANITLAYGQKVNATAHSSAGTLSLFRNGAVADLENGINMTLAAGNYTYLANATGNQNYTDNATGMTFTAFINQAQSRVNLTLNGTEKNASIYTNTSIDLNCSLINPSSGIARLWNNGTLMNSGASPIGNTTNYTLAGTYNVTCDYQGNQNYSASFETFFVNVSIASASAGTNLTCGDLNITNRVYYLNNSVNSSGTCFNVLADNVTLNCQGFMINYSQSVQGYGVNITGFNYTTVKNCRVIQGNATSNSYGISLSSASNGTFANSSIITYGDRSYGIYFYSRSNNNLFSSNTVNTTGSSAFGIFNQLSLNNTVAKNNVTTTGSTAYGILEHSGFNGTVMNNTVFTSGNSSLGIALANETYDLISHNTVDIYGNTSAYGIYVGVPSTISTALSVNNVVEWNTVTTHTNFSLSLPALTLNGGRPTGIMIATSNYNTVRNNNITAMGAGNMGIYAGYHSSFNTTSSNNMIIMNNTVTLLGKNATGIVFNAGRNHTVTGNIVTSTGSGSYGITLSKTNSSSLTSNIISMMGVDSGYLYTTSLNFDNNMTNTTFATNNGSARFMNLVAIPAGANVTFDRFNMSFNSTFLNSSDSGVSFLNTSAELKMLRINLTNPRIMVAYDDVNPIECTSAMGCYNVSYNHTSGTFIFNVSHFTTYSTRETPPAEANLSCGDPLNETNKVYYLNNSVNSSGTCFVINANNVTLDCQGHWISYSQHFEGDGIMINGTNFNTVRNCNIIDPNATQTLGAPESDDIDIVNTGGSGYNNSIVNNSIMGANNHVIGIRLTDGNNVSGNTFTDLISGIFCSGNGNRVYSNVFDGNDEGIRIGNFGGGSAGVNNTFSGNNMTSAYSDIDIYSNSSGNVFIDTMLNASALTYRALLTQDSPNNTFINTTFYDAGGKIFFQTFATNMNNLTVDSSTLKIEANKIFLNTSDAGINSVLNTSARLTIGNLNLTNPRITVAYDDVNFQACNSPQCDKISYSNGTLLFDVSHFTTYSSEETPTPTPTPSSGGGGGGAYTPKKTVTAPVAVPTVCAENWGCSGFGSCVNGKQSRTCTDGNKCGTISKKPSETQSCKVAEKPAAKPSIVSSGSIWMIISSMAILSIILLAVITMLLRNRMLENSLKVMMNQMEFSLGSRDREKAMQAYGEIKKVYDRMPDSSKEGYHDRILNMYQRALGFKQSFLSRLR